MDLNTGQPAQLNAIQMDAILISYVVQSIQFFSQVHRTKHKAQRPNTWNPNFKRFGAQMFLEFKWWVFRSPLYLHVNLKDFWNGDTNCIFRMVGQVTWLQGAIKIHKIFWIMEGSGFLASSIQIKLSTTCILVNEEWNVTTLIWPGGVFVEFYCSSLA